MFPTTCPSNFYPTTIFTEKKMHFATIKLTSSISIILVGYNTSSLNKKNSR